MNQPEFPPPLELIASAETDSIIRSDIKHIDHTPWHKAGLRLWDGALVIPPLVDPMRFVVTAKEAVGVFQLPVPPESGYLPGIRVREEPFVRSQRFGGESLDQLHLGEVLHRGTPSGEQFFISKENLGRHALIAGSTGTGKTYTCLHLLSQLWDRTKDGRRVPFLVIYPVAKPDYRILMDDPVVRDDLLIFTAGDASSPLRFNPFDVPWGVLLRTHISNLMRTFSAALYMWGPLPMLFREALRQVYTEFGWNLHGRRGDDPEQRIPQLRHFHRVLQELSENWAGRYRSDLRGDLRQDSEVKIRDLLESAGNILDVSYDIGKPSIIEQILERPTVIELGRVGSASDIALVVGFLLTLLTEHISTRSDGSLRHLTLIEEAHRLMSAQVNVQGEHVADPRRGGAEEFAHILAEVRGYGEALMLAEQTPTKLIPDAIANTHLKVMHWLEDRLSFDLFSQIMNLNDKQRNHARTLQVGEIITRAESGEPVLLKVPNYRKLLEEKLRARDEKLAKTSTSDQAVEEFMKDQIESKGIAIPQYLAAERQRSSSGGFKTTQSPPGDVQASLPSGRESERNTGEGGKKDDFLRRLHTQREKHNG